MVTVRETNLRFIEIGKTYRESLETRLEKPPEKTTPPLENRITREAASGYCIGKTSRRVDLVSQKWPEKTTGQQVHTPVVEYIRNPEYVIDKS